MRTRGSQPTGWKEEVGAATDLSVEYKNSLVLNQMLQYVTVDKVRRTGGVMARHVGWGMLYLFQNAGLEQMKKCLKRINVRVWGL